MKNEKLNEQAKKILAYGSKAIGIASAATLSSMTESPELKIASKLFGGLLPQVLNDVSNRLLSTREEIKIGMTNQYVQHYIQKNLDNNKEFNIKFIDLIKDSEWTTASELYESVLLKAKNESQEKKIKHIGAVFGNSIFIEKITADDVFQVLSAIEGFTYRKLCIISLYGQKEIIFPERDIMNEFYSWYKDIQLDFATTTILQDIYELISLGIIYYGNSFSNDYLIFAPAKYTLSELGEKYYQLMSLNEIDKDELTYVIEPIEYKDCYGVSNRGTRNGRPE